MTVEDVNQHTCACAPDTVAAVWQDARQQMAHRVAAVMDAEANHHEHARTWRRGAAIVRAAALAPGEVDDVSERRACRRCLTDGLCTSCDGDAPHLATCNDCDDGHCPACDGTGWEDD